jgi:chromosome segregation ATPase
MKSALELDQFDLESASTQQLAEVIQALREQVKKAAAELQSKNEKIQALTYELAYLRRIRYGVKSETFSQLQADLFADTWDEDVAAVEAELEQLAEQQPEVTADKPKRPRASRYRRICHASNSVMNPTLVSAANAVVR